MNLSSDPAPNRLKRLVSLACIFSITSMPAYCEEAWPGADDTQTKKPQSTPAKSDDMIFDADTPRGGGSQTGESAQEESFSSPRMPFKKEVAYQYKAKEEKYEAPSHTRMLVGSAKSTMLFGRIDQIASEAEVKMPDLKAMKAQLDTSQSSRRLTASASTARFSGRVTNSFPMDFSGLWGGTMRVWRYSASRLSDEVDPEESRKMAEILTPGTSGNVNFEFNHDYHGGIDLQPANVRIMIPMQQSYTYQKMMQGGQMGGLGSMMSGMMGNMKIPVMLHFGQISTGGTAEVGISGNQIDQRLVKNEIRQLQADVLEEQIVTKDSSVVQGTGRMKEGYTETVVRFTRRSPQDLYVLAASVDYDSSGKFLRKLIMYGDVFRNQRTDTSMTPAGMGNLQGLLGAGGGGMSQLGGLSSLLGGGGGEHGSPNMANMQQYLNNPAVRSYLQQSGMGGGGGAGGSSAGLGGLGGLGGFSQVINSLNMMNNR